MFISLEGTTVILNGHVVGGWSEATDALTLPEIELAQVQRGADGKMVASSTGNKGGEVQIKLLANSPSTQFLEQQVAQIMRGAAVVWDGSIRNAQAGFGVTLGRGVLMTAPAGQTMGKGEVAERVFAFEFETVLPNYDAATFSGPPQVTPEEAVNG